MTTLGTTTEPTTGQEWFGSNTTNQFAIKLTLPGGGPWEISRLGAWLAGKDMTCTFKLCIWNSSMSLIGESASINAASRSFALGQNDKYEGDLLTPVEVNGGTDVWVGFSRDDDENVQFGTRSGTRRQNRDESYPGSLSGYSTGDAIGAWIEDYHSANEAPNAPTSLQPTGSEVVNEGTSPTVSGTRSDPDSGDYITAYEVEAYQDDGTTKVYDSGKIAKSGTTTTFSRAISLPGVNAFYKWKARTWDKDNVAGPFSSLQRFYANAVPATPAAPVVSSVSDLTPDFSGSFSDPGDSMTHVQLQVVRTSDSVTMWDSGDLADTGTTYSKTYAGTALSFAVQYKVRVRQKDSNGAYSSWSAYTTWTTLQPPGPDNLSPTSTDPRLSSLTPTLTVGHLAETFRNEQIEVRTSPGGGTLMWSKAKEGADYGATNSVNRVYAGTALSYGGVYYWRALVELSATGTDTAWSDWYPFRINADPTAPTGMTPTGGTAVVDPTPELRSTFADPDLDQGDFGEFVDTEVYDNANSVLKWSQTGATPVPAGGSSHAVSVSPTGMASMTTITGVAATDVITRTDHQLANGQKIRFSSLTGGAGLATATDYWVRDVTANTFKVASTLGGSAFDFTTDITAATLVPQELGLEHTYKWRARYTDDMGRVGAWSDYQLFKVSAAATVDSTYDAPVTLATSAAADDIIDTSGSHGYVEGDVVYFTALTGGAGLSTFSPYFVLASNLAATTFQVSTTRGGSPANFTTDITAGTVKSISGPASPVTESTPVLDWTFTGSGGKTQQSYQVRLYDRGPTGALYADEVIVWDTGEVISTATQVTVPLGTLVDEHEYRWEVTVKDTDGLPSVLA